jgi:S-adenosylmethionine:tRNA ribosyltransferase-isomerase
MRITDFDFDLPPELIAQMPAPQRDMSRLLVLHRQSGNVEHRRFREVLECLHVGDLLVLNNSRVIPARLRGRNAHTGGQFEILLLEENAPNDWWVMLRPGKRARVGTQIVLLDARGQASCVRATVLDINDEGHRRLGFAGTPNIVEMLEFLGEVPLPPYITRSDASRIEQDRQRYQTVFAKAAGSVAAPTAGLHFTDSLLAELATRGVQVCFVTLHVGFGTFAPVKAKTIATHIMHDEHYELSEATARAINKAKSAGRRVIAVGTTTVRVLETVAAQVAQHSTSPFPSSSVPVVAVAGKTRIFIYPPYEFRVADALLTNFHLPRSTLLMLVSAFAEPNGTGGRDLILSAYGEAIREGYRFFSYGDAMLIL